jgi:hypothetical protein
MYEMPEEPPLLEVSFAKNPNPTTVPAVGLRVITKEAVLPVKGAHVELTQLPVLLVMQTNPERPTLSLQVEESRQGDPAMVVLAARLEQLGGIRSLPLDRVI